MILESSASITTSCFVDSHRINSASMWIGILNCSGLTIVAIEPKPRDRHAGNRPHLGRAQEQNWDHFQHPDTFTSRICNSQTHKIRSHTYGCSLPKPHAPHLAGSIAFTDPQNRWGILRPISILLATPNKCGCQNQTSGALSGSSRFASAP